MRDGDIAGILGRPVAQGLFLDPAQLPPVKKRGDQRWYQVGDGFRPEGGRRTEGGGQSEQGREIDSLSEEGQGEGKLHHPMPFSPSTMVYCTASGITPMEKMRMTVTARAEI
mgnify:CR=1 FL=1